ncbi:hypothetical protein MFIFM68171_07705 [Madurella fahalii]|uniref:ATPase, vacuolar ER assembly factor, Vma12 n=1 Tax=Madurella fahalii TaxID=1157608 RepID=A0ABQ0GIA8_9PEZI
MVLLTMTPSIVEGLQTWNGLSRPQQEKFPWWSEKPPLELAAVGNPISHSQVVGLWMALKGVGNREYSLEKLLKGSMVYVPPPPLKPEPSDEYKALMAQLRREEEQRAYECMTNPPPPMETFSQQFPNGTKIAQTFAAVNRPARDADIGDDEVTFNDIHRQLMLILNFLASILGVAASLWILARWWSTPARLFLTMGGSILVGIAEVAVYSGYVWHLAEVKKKDKTFKEVKEIVQTWTVGADHEPVTISGGSLLEDANLRGRERD